MLHWASKALFSGSILFIVFWTIKYAAADFYYEKSRSRYKAINIEELESSHELTEMLSHVNQSLVFRPKSANATDFKADLLYRSWWISPDGQYLQESALLQSAVELHLKANDWRKGWVFSASRLAIIYSHQRHLEKKFNHWFSESHRLGLYETQVARSMMILGLQNWPKLTQAQKAMTTDFIRASVEQKSNSIHFIFSILEQYGQLAALCASSSKTSRMNQLCTKAL